MELKGKNILPQARPSWVWWLCVALLPFFILGAKLDFFQILNKNVSHIVNNLEEFDPESEGKNNENNSEESRIEKVEGDGDPESFDFHSIFANYLVSTDNLFTLYFKSGLIDFCKSKTYLFNLIKINFPSTYLKDCSFLE